MKYNVKDFLTEEKKKELKEMENYLQQQDYKLFTMALFMYQSDFLFDEYDLTENELLNIYYNIVKEYYRYDGSMFTRWIEQNSDIYHEFLQGKEKK